MRWFVRIYRQMKNRRVIRAGVIYLAVFWLALQVADIVAQSDLVSENSVRWLILGGLAGFPLTLILSWFFEHPWHQRASLDLAGDIALIAAITVATALLAWQQWSRNLARPVIAVLAIEPTDIHPETEALSLHLARRLRSLLAASGAIRVIELDSSWSKDLAGKTVASKALALGTDYLLAGTLNQTSLNLRLNLQLFDQEGRLVWSGNYRDRLIDQYHLQNAVLEDLWAELRLNEGELLRLREILQSCDYPAVPEIITGLAGVEADINGQPTPGEKQLEAAIQELDALAAGLNEAGLLYLLRAQARVALLEVVPPGSRPVMQRMAKKDIEDAFFLCPALPEVELLTLLNSKALESESEDFPALLERHPNDARLLEKMSVVSLSQGKTDQAQAYRAQACALNPLAGADICP